MWLQVLLASVLILPAIESCAPGANPNAKSGSKFGTIQQTLGGTATADSALPGSYADSRNRGAIKNDDDLACVEFDNCRWRNEVGKDGAPDKDELDWVRARGNPDSEKMLSIFGTRKKPNGKWGVAGSTKPRKRSDKAMYVSDTIACQEGPGLLKFDYWTSSETQIRVCTRKPNDGKRLNNCSPPIRKGAPGPVTARVRSLPDPFEIVIMGENFVNREGAMIMIDSIGYEAKICDPDDEGANDDSEDLDNLDSFEDSDEFVDDSGERPPRPPPRPGREEDNRNNYDIDEDDYSDGDYGPVTERPPRPQPGPRTRVPPSRGSEDDYDAGDYRGGGGGGGSPGGEGGSGDDGGSGGGGGGGGTGRESAACSALKCTGNRGACARNPGAFKVSNGGSVGNPHTGIRRGKEGAYLYAEGGSSSPASLRSPAFRLKDDAQLAFCYYKQHRSLQFNIRAKGRVLWTAPPLNRSDVAKRWKCERAELTKGSYDSVEFTATGRQNKYAIFGLDEINVVDSRGRALC